MWFSRNISDVGIWVWYLPLTFLPFFFASLWDTPGVTGAIVQKSCLLEIKVVTESDIPATFYMFYLYESRGKNKKEQVQKVRSKHIRKQEGKKNRKKKERKKERKKNVDKKK